mmetsp:Transcript_37304/g.87589  ORF Transcript_37304/g.87589 Transcript_37304/m.87589 type:complete len:403 (-) Transcript_37304:685-1893(-)
MRVTGRFKYGKDACSSKVAFSSKLAFSSSSLDSGREEEQEEELRPLEERRRLAACEPRAAREPTELTRESVGSERLDRRSEWTRGTGGSLGGLPLSRPFSSSSRAIAFSASSESSELLCLRTAVSVAGTCTCFRRWRARSSRRATSAPCPTSAPTAPAAAISGTPTAWPSTRAPRLAFSEAVSWRTPPRRRQRAFTCAWRARARRSACVSVTQSAKRQKRLGVTSKSKRASVGHRSVKRRHGGTPEDERAQPPFLPAARDSRTATCARTNGRAPTAIASAVTSVQRTRSAMRITPTASGPSEEAAGDAKTSSALKPTGCAAPLVSAASGWRVIATAQPAHAASVSVTPIPTGTRQIQARRPATAAAAAAAARLWESVVGMERRMAQGRLKARRGMAERERRR